MPKPLLSLKKKLDYKRAYSRKKSVAGSLFVVYAAANNLGQHRLGLSVSKKVGCAVVRNRVRRLVKENCRFIFTERISPNGQAFDLIVIAREAAGKLPREGSYAKVGETLTHLFKRLGVL
ncbi:MAG: ribonuclease P protein component [Defluviitaleaceae bacterium]|nr:ribonuclease P protein component [Defluviitaleaceae bacterium]